MDREYAEFAWKQAEEHLAIDSPAGVYASHGCERSHMDGVYNTL